MAMGEAKRFNEGKPRLSLVPGALQRACARAMMYGEMKYGMHNWRGGGKHMSYHGLADSLNRHLVALLEGQDKDEESGLSHVDHIAADIGFLAELVENGKIIDDRYKEDKDPIKLEITEDTEFIVETHPCYPPGTPDANSPCLKKRLTGRRRQWYNEYKQGDNYNG